MAGGQDTSVWTYILPIVNVALSAGVSWFTATRVATKSAKKQAFVDLLKRVDELEECAERLFLLGGSSAEAAAEFRTVTRHDARLGERLTDFFAMYKSNARLAGADPVPPQISRAFNSLRALACADELVGISRAAFPPNDAKFDVLRQSVATLRRKLSEEAGDMKAHPPAP